MDSFHVSLGILLTFMHRWEYFSRLKIYAIVTIFQNELTNNALLELGTKLAQVNIILLVEQAHLNLFNTARFLWIERIHF